MHSTDIYHIIPAGVSDLKLDIQCNIDETCETNNKTIC